MDAGRLHRGDLFPPLTDLRAVTHRIAAAVAKVAIDSGNTSGVTVDEVEDRLHLETWNLDYPRLVPG
jgi:malic enzyme